MKDQIHVDDLDFVKKSCFVTAITLRIKSKLIINLTFTDVAKV